MHKGPFANDDHAASDDMEEILEYTRRFHNEGYQNRRANGPSNGITQKLEERIAEREQDVRQAQEDIQRLQNHVEVWKKEVEEMKQQLRAAAAPLVSNLKGKGKAPSAINYQEEEFEWAKALQARMKKVFKIDNFRLCQKGVCNANMDSGGKSLTYQLPALLTAGCTIVISPLLSLMIDQIMHMEEAGIAAVMLNGMMSKNEKKETMQRLHDLVDSDSNGKEIKLCYVTPEKLAKDKTVMALLTKLANGGKLARFVIDEAHCVSSLGHDFRPDYKNLHKLRQHYPRVPIMALSATCPPQVLNDLVKILGLPPIVDGNAANVDGTVYFSSPLYRKNLHYKVLPKPSKAADVYRTMADYILKHHPNDTGIVYCFSKKDTEVCAEKLAEVSNNKIRTGTYHAEIADGEKTRLHEAWRAGHVKVVCATIAFGLGIDKGDVRFVLHHSIPKSLDGYYQESGRAGRDGKDANCILYYRPQDGIHLSSLTSGETGGVEKLHHLLDFVEDVRECRKVQFASYFRHSAQLSITSWSTADKDALERCGHCDNCMRPPESIETKDVTLASWQVVRIAAAVERMGGNVTLNMLATLARGKGGSKIEVTRGKGRQSSKEKIAIDLDQICGGPVNMSTDDIEHLIVQLLVKNYLREDFHTTAYAVNVYLSRGTMAAALVNLSKEQVMQSSRRRIEVSFIKSEGKNKKTKAAAQSSSLPKGRKGKEKEKTKAKGDDSETNEYIDCNEGIEDLGTTDSDDGHHPTILKPAAKRRLGARKEPEIIDIDESESDGGGWVFNQRGVPPRKKLRASNEKVKAKGKNSSRQVDQEVMVLSSD